MKAIYFFNKEVVICQMSVVWKFIAVAEKTPILVVGDESGFETQQSWVKYLKKMTHYISIERDADITLSDLVRESIENTFPMPKDDSGK